MTIDTSSVNHALKKTEHHITKEDFKKIKKVVNKNSTIALEGKTHQNNSVLHFYEKKTNGLQIIMEVRAGRGDLALVTIYRPKKAK